MTYSRSSQISPTGQNNRKITTAPNSEKPKLKIIQEETEKNNFSTWFNNKKQRKNISSLSKIVAIGDAIFRSNF